MSNQVLKVAAKHRSLCEMRKTGPATDALQRSFEKRHVSKIPDERKNIVSSSRKKMISTPITSFFNFDDAFQVITASVAEVEAFPQIEWCFDDVDDIDTPKFAGTLIHTY